MYCRITFALEEVEMELVIHQRSVKVEVTLIINFYYLCTVDF